MPNRRRRLLDRLSRISSSPQLTTPPSSLLLGAPLSPTLTPHHASSTLTLAAPHLHPAQTVHIPYGTDGETLQITVPLLPPPRRDLWTPLPPELKLHILRHLSHQDLLRTAPTSRDFAALTRDGQLWATLDTTRYYSRIPAAQLAALITTAAPFLRHLNLRGCLQLAADWRQDAVYFAPQNLRSVILEGAQPAKSALGNIVHRNPHLTRLDIAGCRALTPSVARLIAQSLPELEALDISWCTALEPRGLRRIVEGCARLRDLRACGVPGFDDTAVMAAVHAANRITSLTMNSCAALTDDAIRTLCLGPSHLSGGAAASSPPPPRKLTRLAVAACPRLTDAALHVLAAHAPHLAAFEAAGDAALTDAGLAALFARARGLAHVDVEGCVAVSDAAVVALARHGAVVYLNVGGCADVGDGGVVEVLRRCGGLRCVEADGTGVTDRVLDEAVRAVRYRGVGEVAVAVYDCPGVTWEGVRGVMAQNAGGVGGRVKVKCYFGWQAVVDTHWERCGRGEFGDADKVERAWAAFMAGEAGGGRRRRRRGMGAFGVGVGGGGGAWMWEAGGVGAGGERRGRGRCVIC
ncbi:hypothetical protein DFP73DRAFT_493128, partial [Morchella snyderi]